MPVKAADDVAPLDEPLNEAFRAGTLTLGWDGERKSVLIEARAQTEEEDDPEGLEDLDASRTMPTALTSSGSGSRPTRRGRSWSGRCASSAPAGRRARLWATRSIPRATSAPAGTASTSTEPAALSQTDLPSSAGLSRGRAAGPRPPAGLVQPGPRRPRHSLPTCRSPSLTPSTRPRSPSGRSSTSRPAPSPGGRSPPSWSPRRWAGRSSRRPSSAKAPSARAWSSSGSTATRASTCCPGGGR